MVDVQSSSNLARPKRPSTDSEERREDHVLRLRGSPPAGRRKVGASSRRLRTRKRAQLPSTSSLAASTGRRPGTGRTRTALGDTSAATGIAL